MDKKNEKIYSILNQIDRNLKRQISLKRIFIQGMVRGLGTALGATVILAIFTTIILKTASTLDIEMILQYFFNDAVNF
jgi:hypothetical protein